MGQCIGKVLEVVQAQSAPPGQQQSHGVSIPSHGPGAAHSTGQHAPAHGVKYTIENVRVNRVPDGDTFAVDYVDQRGQQSTGRVRLMGVDCPESSQQFGPEARDIGRAMALNHTVTLHVHTTDQYGRLVADVITDAGLDYGKELLRAGAAWHYSRYDKRPELERLMQDAKQARIGLWAHPNPQAPWEYRRQHPRQNR